MQEDCFRALGRAFFSGAVAGSPILRPELAYDKPTPAEEEVIADLETKLVNTDPRRPEFYRLDSTQVSGLVRLTCDLGHYVQGTSPHQARLNRRIRMCPCG